MFMGQQKIYNFDATYKNPGKKMWLILMYVAENQQNF